MKLRVLIFLFLLLVLIPGVSSAQHWKKIADFNQLGFHTFVPYFVDDTVGFLGMAGTGAGASNTDSSAIFKSMDGGVTWRLTSFPDVKGVSVLGFYFLNEQHGFAAVEASQDILSQYEGIFETTDGGATWKNILSGYNTAAVYASNGVIFADGGYLSTDGGVTWKPSSIPVDRGSSVTGNKDAAVLAAGGPGNQTFNQRPAASSDNGKTWQRTPPDHTGWTIYSIAHSLDFFEASEENWDFSPPVLRLDSGVVYHSRDGGLTWRASLSRNKSFQLTGGIAGSGCPIYVQLVNDPSGTSLQYGLYRTTDRGSTWKFVDGPGGVLDSRISVTGRGSIVYAMDTSGALWKTTDGGDGSISRSMLRDISIEKKSPTLSHDTLFLPCGTQQLKVIYSYLGCDNASIDSVHLTGNGSNFTTIFSKHLLQSQEEDTAFISIASPISDTLKVNVITYFHQEDGTLEDSTFPLVVISQASKPVVSLNLDTLDFGTVNICDASLSKVFTLSNAGCQTLQILETRLEQGVDSSYFTPPTPPFDLAANSAPHSFTVLFLPRRTGKIEAKIVLRTNVGFDTVYAKANVVASSGKIALSLDTLQFPTIREFCDSMTLSTTLSNGNCRDLVIDSAQWSGNSFTATPNIIGLKIPTNTSANISIRFLPIRSGIFRDSAVVYYSILDKISRSIVLHFRASAVPAPDISYYLQPSQISAPTDSLVTIPLVLDCLGDSLDIARAGFNGFTIVYGLNTDLLSYVDFVPVEPEAIVSNVISATNSIAITVTLKPGFHYTPHSILALFHFQPYLTDTVHTAFRLLSQTAVLSKNACLGTAATPDSLEFTLVAKCGNPTLENFLKGNLDFRILSIEPNPSKGAIEVDLDNPQNERLHYQVLALTGAVEASGEIEGTRSNLQLSSLTAGVYFLRFTSLRHTETKRFTILR